jgi:hypothetical protein
VRNDMRNATASILTGTMTKSSVTWGQPEALLILGPGEAKLQLEERRSHSKALTESIVGIETTDKLSDPQIVAKVKAHYGIDR